jgi:hypothetical protein
MSIIYAQTYGPDPEHLCVGFIDQGNGRFRERWFYPREVTAEVIKAHHAFFCFRPNRVIILVVMSGPAPDYRLTFHATTMPGIGPVATKVAKNKKPGDKCANVNCGSISCPDPEYPFLVCTPTPHCAASEVEATGETGPAAARTAKAKRAKPQRGKKRGG